jgi:hypothetical protein
MRCLGRASNKADLRSENLQWAAISNKITAVSRDLLNSDTCRREQQQGTRESFRRFAIVCAPWLAFGRNASADMAAGLVASNPVATDPKAKSLQQLEPISRILALNLLELTEVG